MFWTRSHILRNPLIRFVLINSKRMQKKNVIEKNSFWTKKLTLTHIPCRIIHATGATQNYNLKRSINFNEFNTVCWFFIFTFLISFSDSQIESWSFFQIYCIIFKNNANNNIIIFFSLTKFLFKNLCLFHRKLVKSKIHTVRL